MIEGIPSIGVNEVIAVALAIIAIALLGRFLGVIKKLVMNTVGGIVVLFAAQTLGISIAYTPLTLGIAALAGLPGGVLIVLLSMVGVQIDLPHNL